MSQPFVPPPYAGVIRARELHRLRCPLGTAGPSSRAVTGQSVREVTEEAEGVCERLNQLLKGGATLMPTTERESGWPEPIRAYRSVSAPAMGCVCERVPLLMYVYVFKAQGVRCG